MTETTDREKVARRLTSAQSQLWSVYNSGVLTQTERDECERIACTAGTLAAALTKCEYCGSDNRDHTGGKRCG